MFLRSRSVVRHSCSGGLLLRTEAEWLLIRSESRERVSALPPITTTYYHVNPWPLAVSQGSRARVGGNDRRGEEQQEIESMLPSRRGESESSRCLQMFRWRISDRRWSRWRSCWPILPLVSHLMNIWAANLSVQPQKPPLMALMWISKTTRALFPSILSSIN